MLHITQVVIAAIWPGVNPQPFQQGRIASQTGGGGVGSYERYLQNPPVQSWDQVVAIPVEWYAQLYQTSCK